MRAEFGARPEEVSFRAGHVLFVEGRGSDAVDTTALNILLEDMVRIEPMGSASGIEGAARALWEYHPTYYFLIDRDHRSDDDVERTWRRFPDPEQSNLLIWRRRELENYFLIPEYLRRSRFGACTLAELRECIRATVEDRIFLDAANSVIVTIREQLKKMNIPLLKPAAGCVDHKTTLDCLLQKPEFNTHSKGTASLLSDEHIRELLDAKIEDFLGKKRKPRWGEGRWLELINGKEVLNIVIDKCFDVKDAAGKKLQGKVKLLEVAKDLLRLPLEEQPDDFQQLHRLILEHVRKAA